MYWYNSNKMTFDQISVFICVLLTCVCGKIEESLVYYETLHYNDVKVHSFIKRSLSSSVVKKVSYSAFNRDFHIVLKKTRDFFHHEFTLSTVDKQGNEIQSEMNQNDFYTGFVKDDSESHVDAYWEDGVLTASIITKEGEYTIEPSWRHFPNNGNYSMIIYRASDLKGNISGYNSHFLCGGAHLSNSHLNDSKSHDLTHPVPQESLRRSKRSGSEKTSCAMMLVADYHFFVNEGMKSIPRTSKLMAHLLQKVSNIFQDTKFGNLENIGLSIKKILIHKEPSINDGSYYKLVPGGWDSYALLTAFSRQISSAQYCLRYLFTHQRLPKGVLGLAYTASPSPWAAGGLCSPQVQDHGGIKDANLGLVTSMNTFGIPLPLMQTSIVFAHEIGHSWGSEHDPGSEVCVPSTAEGGKYIMYAYAVTGRDPNNVFFSPCSINSITKVLESKGDSCFEESRVSLCGNGFIDGDEECDAGFESETSRCCDANCQLVTNAECSPETASCCTEFCRLSPFGTLCFQGDVQDLSCLADSRCDGKNKMCPQRSFKPDNTPCGDGGKCESGTCRPYCETMNKISCTCDQLEKSCLWCCMGNDKVCRPEGKKLLTDGRPCLAGFCKKGVCQKTDSNLIVRLWNIIDMTSINALGKFLKSNIVMTVVFLSLMAWIPASIYITRMDEKHAKVVEKIKVKKGQSRRRHI